MAMGIARQVAEAENMSAADRLRKSFGMLTEAEKEAEQTGSKVANIFRADANARRAVELEWWRNETFYDGEFYVFNRKTNKLEETKGADRIFINKARQQVRGVVSYLNKEHPFVRISPGVQSDEAYSNAKNTQLLCSYWYDHLQMNATNKRVTQAAAKVGLGWVKILWDPKASVFTTPFGPNGKKNKVRGELTYDYADPYDVYPDPRMTSWDDCRRITHAVPTTLGAIGEDPRFANAANIVADDKQAASEIKRSFMARETGYMNEAEDTDPSMRTVILLEQFRWEYRDGKRVLRLQYATEQGILLHEEDWPLPFVPWEYYQTDVCNRVYESDGAIKHIRGLNQALNRSASQMEENADRMGKLHYVAEKGSGVNVIHDQIGTIMEVNQGRRFPEQVKPAGMPAYVENHQGNLERWIDDIGGIHDASYGRLPTSRASGELVKGLQDGDNNSLSMYRDNFDDFLVRSFKKMLGTEKYHRAKLKITRTIPSKEVDPLGRYAWTEIRPDQINVDDEIQVRSGTRMPYSNAARQEMVMGFYDKGLFNGTPAANAALKLMDIQEVENIQGNEQPHIERQGEELRKMVEGTEIDDPIVAENHAVHIRVLDQFINSPAWYKVDETARQTILDHRKRHAVFQEQLARAAAATQFEPIKRSETLMVAPKNLNELTPVERTSFLGHVGIETDMDEIQVRGGLIIQKPEDALEQADIENQLFKKGMAPRVSPTDNHQVHLEVHELLRNDPMAYDALAKSSQDFLTEHIKQHQMIIQTQQAAPGLVSNSDTGSHVPDHTLTTAEEKAKLKAGDQGRTSEAPAEMDEPAPESVEPSGQPEPSEAVMED